MILANRNNLAVRFAAATEENRYTLKAILATENETVATDGHMLCRVSLPNQKAENFPTVEGFNPNGFTRGLIPVDVAKSIESSIPKSKNLPILRHAAITTEHTADDREVIKALTTDLENPKVFTVRPIEGQFPKWDSDSLWSSERPAVDVCFDARLLAAIAGAASKFSDNDRMCPVRLRLYSSNAAMRFDVVNDDGQEMNGLLMPCRASVNPTFKEPKPEPELVAAVEPEPEPVAAVEPEPEPVAAVEPEPEPVAAVEPEPEPVAAVEPESLQSIAGSGRLVIAAGFGYWDVSHYPYGGDFRRAEPNCKVTEIVRDLPDRGECEVVLYSGHRAIVRKVALVDYQY